MKHVSSIKPLSVAIAGLLGLVFSPQPAEAIINLVFENGPFAGQAHNGPVTIHLEGLANGTVYPALTPNTGLQANSNAVNVGLLNGIAGQTAPNGPVFPGTVAPASGEDIWGIVRLTLMTAVDPGGNLRTVWSPTGKNQDVTGIVYGGQDIHVSTGGGFQIDDIAGGRLDLYSRPLGTFPLDLATATAAQRLTASTFINATTTLGQPMTLELQLASVPNMINGDAVGSPNAGRVTEWSSLFNPSSNVGSGSTYLNVLGGASNAIFNTNGFDNDPLTALPGSNVRGFDPGAPLTIADLQSLYTINQTSTWYNPVGGIPGATRGWLAAIQDPINGNVIPEPSSMLAGIGCLAPVLGALTRRRRKR